MKQEDKELLLKDLCTRLLYGVKIKVLIEEVEYDAVVHGVYADETVFVEQNPELNKVHRIDVVHVSEVKPYLFPLSSITEEQEEEFNDLFYRYHESAFIFNERLSYDRCSIKDIGFYPCYLQDWLNKNHFDYRGLIPMGLAIDATNLNIY